MRRLVSVVLLTALITVGGDATAQQPSGSQLPIDRNTCATCHGEADLWEGNNRRLYSGR